MDDFVKGNIGDSIIGNSMPGANVSERDMQELAKIVALLNKCRNRRHLKTVFQSNILPVLEAQSALYAWIDPDLCNAQFVDCVNIPRREIPAIREFIHLDPRAHAILSHPYPVIARDVFSPEGIDEFGNKDVFFNERPKHKGYDYFDTAHSGRITMALREPSFCAGIHRRHPHEKPWTLRDVRIFEFIRPHLMHVLMNILLAEELVRSKELLTALADCPDGVAVVNPMWKISFCNKEFANLFGVKAGSMLSGDIRAFAEKEKNYKLNSRSKKSRGSDVHIFETKNSDFKVQFNQINGKVSDLNESWLLRLGKVQNSDGIDHDFLNAAGLTGRESEICDLAREGLGDREIADELYISPHTVKAHMKKIHEKLEVHTRAQLIATLNR
jgi:DNA-binding CsgD family transcriptional regulator/PAS domain-containing protein